MSLTDAFKKDADTRLDAVRTCVTLLVVLFAILFPLSSVKKRFAKVWLLKIVSWACYMLVPILLSYTLGLMKEMPQAVSDPEVPRDGALSADYVDMRVYVARLRIIGVFLLFVNANFDNISAFSLEEIHERSKIFFQFLTQFALILFFVYNAAFIGFQGLLNIPILVGLLAVFLKVVERIVALAHSAGATPGIKRNLKNVINYMNNGEGVELELVDPVSMKGFQYLVGPRYSETKDGAIVEGITIENVWECNGRLLSSESGGGDPDGKLKDTCLSFSLFWLLLGKFWGYPLYKGDSRRKAWRLVHDGLLATKLGESERVFRVIEVELSFLHDYFYSKYFFYYLHGFYWKLCAITFPIILWWVNQTPILHRKVIEQPMPSIEEPRPTVYYTIPNSTIPNTTPHARPTSILIAPVILFLEVIQLSMLIASRWLEVTLLSYYAKREMSKRKIGFLHCCFEKVVGVICRISQYTSTILSKPWKRELDQYSLLESCTCFSVDNNVLQGIAAVFGIPLPKQGRKQGSSVVLSEDVKRAVVLSLQTNGPKLSNGIASLRRNEAEEGLSWACILESDVEIILVWHIATSICEIKSQQNGMQPMEDFKVATTLSKYCGYLLACSPSLLHVPRLEAEVMCDISIIEARKLFKKPGSHCGYIDKVNKCEKLMELCAGDIEVGASKTTTMQKGAKLGEKLLSIVEDEGRRWKILAELWAELILFLAPSNNNEMAHVEKLADGGEFITHLWALLIHAGDVDRDPINFVAHPDSSHL